MGVLLWRDFSLDDVMAQCFGHEGDTSGKGRQMPVVRSGPYISIRDPFRDPRMFFLP
jgi:TPP-dependent pyruvate/acetoin dehydrogenase alpha subunit